MFVVFEIYFPTFAQGAHLSEMQNQTAPRLTFADPPAVASFSPTAMAASVLFSSLFSFVIIFNGVVQVRFFSGCGSAPMERVLTVLPLLTAIRPTSVRDRDELVTARRRLTTFSDYRYFWRSWMYR